MFESVLIANRGEIACRVIRTARRLGVRAIAVHSDADAGAKHVREADEALRIGGNDAADSYLSIENIIAAAVRSGANAIHPGYGFLSENADFRRACDAAGIVLVGPPLSALTGMGGKAEAKKLMEGAGVPLLPGYHGADQTLARLRSEAAAIGFPVLIKASAGGGGKGMRRVDALPDFDAALESCKREAAASFGDAQVLLEKYVTPARHVEIQIFGDNFGDCVALHERDCSAQRRHQKVIEEAPAPNVSPEQRARMAQAAVAAAKAVNYAGAGTVEFIVAPDGAFYFLEMNTRLQVEHPVTECITGLDLVEWQLRVASGERLPLRQDEIPCRGHAFEARIYAEDPAKNFLPSPGRLTHLRFPREDAHLRVDAGVDAGDLITPFYDPMIAKLIVHDETRESALARLRTALAQCEIAGVAGNTGFLGRLAATTAFRDGVVDTGLIEREQATLLSKPAVSREIFLAAALAQALAEAEDAGRRSPSPWTACDGFRLNGEGGRVLHLVCGEDALDVVAFPRAGAFALRAGGEDSSGAREPDGRLRITREGQTTRFSALASDAGWTVFCAGESYAVREGAADGFAVAGEDAAGNFAAPMSGRIVAVFAEVGAEVEKGAPLVAIEAMKMEHSIHAPCDGVLRAVHVAAGDQVAEGAVLLEFEAAAKK